MQAGNLNEVNSLIRRINSLFRASRCSSPRPASDRRRAVAGLHAGEELGHPSTRVRGIAPLGVALPRHLSVAKSG